MKENENPWFNHYDKGTPRHLAYPEVPLHWFLDRATTQFGDRLCCRFGDSLLTYSGMNKLTRRLAGYLVRLGMKTGDRVALILPNCPHFVIAFYGIARAGGVVVAINPAYKPVELTFQLENSGARFAIVLDTVYPLLKALQAGTGIEKILVASLADQFMSQNIMTNHSISEPLLGDAYFADCLAEEKELPGEPTILPDMPVIFQFSGGTTGISKAAIGTHRNLVANTLQFRAWLGELRDGEEIVLAAIPLFHVYGMVIAMSLAVALGAALVLIADPRDMMNILTSIDRYKATLFPGVPSMYQAIIQSPEVLEGKFDLKSIKACISGSAPLLPEIKLKFESLTGGKLLEGYGLSEAPTATHCNPFLGENRTGSIGLPLPDVDAAIVDIEDGKAILASGEPGELIIRGPQVMPGYHANPEETALTLQDGWLHTGDIARMDEDGYFYLVGRKKEMIKIGGFQVWPREVEEVIASHPAVLECAVAGVIGSEKVEIVKTWIVLRQGFQVSIEEIRDWCEERIARYKVPSDIEFITKLPRTTVGKVLKRELIRLHYEQNPPGGSS